jgi:hypothetical protein
MAKQVQNTKCEITPQLQKWYDAWVNVVPKQYVIWFKSHQVNKDHYTIINSVSYRLSKDCYDDGFSVNLAFPGEYTPYSARGFQINVPTGISVMNPTISNVIHKQNAMNDEVGQDLLEMRFHEFRGPDYGADTDYTFKPNHNMYLFKMYGVNSLFGIGNDTPFEATEFLVSFQPRNTQLYPTQA